MDSCWNPAQTCATSPKNTAQAHGFHRQRRHPHLAFRHAGGNPRGSEALHGYRQVLPRLFPGRGQPRPRQHARGKLPEFTRKPTAKCAGGGKTTKNKVLRTPRKALGGPSFCDWENLTRNSSRRWRTCHCPRAPGASSMQARVVAPRRAPYGQRTLAIPGRNPLHREGGTGWGCAAPPWWDCRLHPHIAWQSARALPGRQTAAGETMRAALPVRSSG